MSKGEQTRAAILDEGLALTSQVGLEGVSIGGLAARAGMSKSGLYAHFESKEALQIEILERAGRQFIDDVIAPALAAPRGLPRVRAFFEAWLSRARSGEGLPGGCVFVAAASELDDRPGPLRDTLVGMQRDWLGALARAARIAVEEGHFRPDLDDEQFAYDLYSIILAHHHFVRLLEDPDAERRTRRAFERLVADAATS